MVHMTAYGHQNALLSYWYFVNFMGCKLNFNKVDFKWSNEIFNVYEIQDLTQDSASLMSISTKSAVDGLKTTILEMLMDWSSTQSHTWEDL